MRPIQICLALLLILPALTSGAAATETPTAEQSEAGVGLFLYPDIHEDFVVFVHGEDLWRVSTQGGVARRLTSHAGQELFPKISPDGQWIAFSAQYSGARQVWVMPAEGGAPRQLTFYTDVGNLPPRGGYDYWILDWTADGKILVRANRTPWGRRVGRYFLVDPEGGLETPLPMAHGGTASYSPDGQSLAFTPIDREFRTWKHSRGGRAQDIWIYDFAAQSSRRVTDFRGTDSFPMWSGETIYFLSDRSYTLDLFAHDVTSGESRQVTSSDDTWDVLWPSQGPSNIVFVQGGELRRLDLKTETVTEIPIRVAVDWSHTVPRFEDVADNIQGGTLSPSGQRVILEARGDLFSVPAEKGPIRNLTNTLGVRERDPAWSPDGRSVAYLSDATGEYEIWIRERAPESLDFGQPRQLTRNGRAWRFAPVWSPDGSKLAFADRGRSLRILDAGSGEETLVDTGYRGDLRTYTWSPDSRWLAYQRTVEGSRQIGISLYSVKDKKVFRLGDEITPDFSPAWSADGKYLFFLSNRDYAPTFSSFEFNFLYDRATRIYVAALDPDAPALFPLESDEEEGETKKAKKKKGSSSDDKKDDDQDRTAKDDDENGEAEKKAATASPDLDPDGYMVRTVALPGIEAGNYRNLVAAKDAVYFLSLPHEGRPSLERYDLDDRKVETVIEGAAGFELSADGERILYTFGDTWTVADAKKGGGDNRRLDLAELRVKVDPRAEWQQMYDDAWRIIRDWFYDENMHGLSWEALGERYGSLIPRLSHRSDLDWVLSELVGELGAGHMYVQTGEMDGVEQVGGGKLGAELEAHPSGVYRISRILRGENWEPRYRSPLTEPGSEVEEGSFLLAIDGQKLTTDDNPYRLLEGKSEMQVVLTVNDEARFDGAKDVTIHTLASEGELRYIDWVKSRADIVDRLSGGRIGYIHLPDTAFDGNRMMQKLFFGQAEKEALIIDDRYNGGGFIPDRMIEYLTRTNMAYWAMRDIDSMRTPGFAHDGPKVMLMNGYSSSGGDALPYFFRQQGLGKLIGSRTWGGLIGLNGNPSLADGGSVAVCTFRIYDEEGNWVVEDEGVTPDIEVFDVTEAYDQDSDPSIEVAVKELLEELESNPVGRPEVPTPPDLSRDAWLERNPL